MVEDTEVSENLSPSAIQEKLTEGLKAAGPLQRIPNDFVDTCLGPSAQESEALSRAVDAIYKRVYYSFVVDLELDPRERRAIGELQRVLRINEEHAQGLNYLVGLSLYKKAFRDSVSDGELTGSERDKLSQIAAFFGLRKKDINAAISEQALWFYSFKLTEALGDGVLSEDEMAELTVISKQFGLTQRQVSGIQIPEKREILRAALADAKAKGSIDEADRDHIRTLVRFLNAGELLKACLMDLDLYERLFQIRDGRLPELDPGALILEHGEHLHRRSAATYEVVVGGKTQRTTGFLYVGSVKIRFVGKARSHEIRYKNILEVSFVNSTRPKLQIAVSSGKGSGCYRLARQNDPSELLCLKEMIGFLIRKARRMLEPTRKDSAYIPEHVRSEVYARDGGSCVICGARDYLEFDHIIARSKGGATSVENLQLLCRRCNSEKSDRI